MSKYHNIRTEVDGIKFASKKEAKRYQELKLLEKAGEINGLELQPKFDFPIYNEFQNGPIKYPSGRVVKYVADFGYRELHNRGGENAWYEDIIEDVKGVQTPVFKLKAALMKAVHGIEVRLT